MSKTNIDMNKYNKTILDKTLDFVSFIADTVLTNVSSPQVSSEGRGRT